LVSQPSAQRILLLEIPLPAVRIEDVALAKKDLTLFPLIQAIVNSRILPFALQHQSLGDQFSKGVFNLVYPVLDLLL